ncbi:MULTISPECIES: GatB/YqeY domain-containing protein [Exiguobacterium]|uniref:GatB/YqeY domain-containing protein n=1 Tax=Exiguobacterium antarcticum TaxID=132920 RepID=A0ABT6QZM7_9BACL|nr:MULTISPECIES: GatB/YqeY domain-containing protein [Exiguobacterium]AFS69933.1 protein yqeY [Exiguobacterium antarcticum B7]MCT4781435.1 GatB/YqeY domain-containing protein [Exiguobacterium soli]MDI3234055.1 GatB/YqeY domain-containing protein [Exiguobacterium antarcticum]
MSLQERLTVDMKEAMRAREKDRLTTIRMVKSSLQNEAIKLGKQELTDEEELTILSREMKQRNDSLREFERADRHDLVEKIQAEIIVLEAYMPKQLSEEEVQEIIDAAIAKTGASAPSDMGKVMGIVMPQLKGKADGALINRLVKQQLH